MYTLRVQYYMDETLITDIKGPISLQNLQEHLKALSKQENVKIYAIRIVRR